MPRAKRDERSARGRATKNSSGTAPELAAWNAKLGTSVFPLQSRNADAVTRQENGTSTGNRERLGPRFRPLRRKCFLQILDPCPTKFVRGTVQPQVLLAPASTMMRHRLLPGFAILALAVVPFVTPAHAVPLGQPCGDAEGATCDKGLWCEPPAGACTSNAGVCIKVPRLCIARKHGKSFEPVCGCNNKTYSNDCFRRAYKMAKAHDGKC